MESKIEKESVTIALIDDGVNSIADEIPRLEDGKSYYGQREKGRPFRDYYTGPSLHGTEMASCIYKVCPMVQLYVGRLDDSNSPAERFTVDSAIKVGKYCVLPLLCDKLPLSIVSDL